MGFANWRHRPIRAKEYIMSKQVGLEFLRVMLSNNYKTLGLGDDPNNVGADRAIRIIKAKPIVAVGIVNNYYLDITFSNGAILRMYDDGQKCCERRYMDTDDPLSYFAGSKLIAVEVRDASERTWPEVQFLVVTTSKGAFTVANYNDHNGYYGGWDITARMELPDHKDCMF